MQLNFLVKDMDAALTLWTEKLGVGPFIVFDQALGNRRFIHRGAESPVDMAVALSYVGDTQIELICQRNDAPSIYTEAFQAGLPDGGVQHIAFWPDDIHVAARELKARGFEEIASIRSIAGEVDVFYLSSPQPLAPMLELVPMTSARRVYFGKIKSLCEQSSIERPVLRFKNKDDFLQSIG